MKTDQTGSARTGEILKQASEALAANDAPAFADRLVDLVQAEPQRWTSLLFLAGVLPEPGSHQFADRLKQMLLGLKAALDRVDGRTLDELIRLLHSITTVEAVIRAIRETLDSLGIWSRPNQETMYRLAVFLEDQNHLLESIPSRDAVAGSFFDPSTLMADSLHDSYSPNVFSRLGVFENICESLQLVHAYLIHEKGGLNGPIENPASPYGDPDIQKLLMLAGAWRSIKDLWGWIRYHGWHPSVLPDDVVMYHPPVPDDLLRYEIGVIRRELLKLQISMSAARYDNWFTDAHERLSELAASVVLNGSTLIWDLKLNTSLLSATCKLTQRSVLSSVAMEILHYEEMARDLKIGKSPSQVSWQQLFACADALAVLCSAYHVAVKQQVKVTDKEFSPKEVFLVPEERLSAVLAECTVLPVQIVRQCVKRLCFDVGSRSLEAWDTPLIRVSSDLLLVTPALATTGDPIRTLENLASQWNERLFTDRGPLLEREALAFLAALDGVVATGPVTFYSVSEGRDVEFDVVARWEGQIFLIEAKCTKMIFGPRDLHRARTNVKEAVDQLIVRKRVLLNEWRKMKAILPDVCCENDPVSPDRVSMLALTNVTHFTGAKFGEVLVVDEFAFRRYFDEVGIHAIVGNRSLGEIVSLRQAPRPTARDFLDYLEDPPQVAMIRNLMKEGLHYHPIVREGGPKIVSMKYEFQGLGEIFRNTVAPTQGKSEK